MSRKEFTEELIPDFLDVRVDSIETEQDDVEEAVEIVAEDSGNTYRAEVAFHETPDFENLAERQVQIVVRDVVHQAMQDRS